MSKSRRIKTQEFGYLFYHYYSVALDRGDGNGFYTFGGIDAAKAGVQESE